MSIGTAPKIGVLDIQGSVEEHIEILKKCGISPVCVKTKKDLTGIDGLIIPGGESTTIGKLMKKYGIDREIKSRAFSKNHPLAIWGTCAGAILLAKKVINSPPQTLGLMNVAIARNAYGRQLDSFETQINIPCLGRRKIPAVFIRAPQIKRASPLADVLAKYNGQPIMARQKNFLITTFHPEMTKDTRVHLFFIELVKKYSNAKKQNRTSC